MKVVLINIGLYPQELEMLDNAVKRRQEKSFNPAKVNRSTVIRELLQRDQAEALAQTTP